MAIDVEDEESPGWWMLRGARELRCQQDRVQPLIDRLEGNGPLPHGADGLEEAYRAFQRKARTNWPERIVGATRERMKLEGFRTSVDDDLDADEEAAMMARRARFFAELPDVLWFQLGCGVGYMMIGQVDGRTVATAEDPRQVVTFHDPATHETRAGFKMLHDVDAGLGYAYLFRPTEGGRCRRWVAKREIARTRKALPRAFSPQSWEWDEEKGGEAGQEVLSRGVPIVRYLNDRGVGEFELHTDLLDRITHQVLQRLVITAMQAYQQRALIGVPEEDDEGNPIDLDGLLHASPGAIWDLPEGVKLEEFTQADMQGLALASKDDIRELCAVTATPVPVLIPEGQNQSAEGAAFAKESLVFKVHERNAVTSDPAARSLALIAEYEGDESRSDPATITPIWADPARRSLAEMADAASKAREDLPLVERLQKIWGYSPEDAAKIADAKRAELQEASVYQFAAAGA